MSEHLTHEQAADLRDLRVYLRTFWPGKIRHAAFIDSIRKCLPVQPWHGPDARDIDPPIYDSRLLHGEQIHDEYGHY